MSLSGTIVSLLVAAILVSVAAATETVEAGNGTPVEIGEVIPAENLQIVKEPGRYGLGPGLPGSHYAVVGDLLIRINAETGAVQSIIRKVQEKRR
ncbi:hypothetical protein [Paracoccus albus]|uniref:hypothetical protein n=1 Tax=Paracoccus albus TaxID=3017784 RepID=UPI0022F0DF19|nr:hypothetical protein [Paracoccus albus]WBU59459.1 hypothetical protein PAF20_11870 [Paracoccus albus]